MLRFVNICLVLGLVALAYVIYQVKYEARALDEEIASLNKDIDTERDGLAVLRAEWSLLNRPERIERLAEKYLKLAPVQPRQLVTLDSVRDRDFTLSRVEVAATTPTPAEAAGHGAKQAGKVTASGATSPEATSATARCCAMADSEDRRPASGRRPIDRSPCATPPNQMPPQRAPSGLTSRAAVIASASPAFPLLLPSC